MTAFLLYSTIVILIAVVSILVLNARWSAKKDHKKFENKETPIKSIWSAPTDADRWEPFPTRPTGLTIVVHDEETDLEAELERALADEDYLLAAAIRDELKSINELKTSKQKSA